MKPSPSPEKTPDPIFEAERAHSILTDAGLQVTYFQAGDEEHEFQDRLAARRALWEWSRHQP